MASRGVETKNAHGEKERLGLFGEADLERHALVLDARDRVVAHSDAGARTIQTADLGTPFGEVPVVNNPFIPSEWSEIEDLLDLIEHLRRERLGRAPGEVVLDERQAEELRSLGYVN